MRVMSELNEKGGYPIGLMESADYEAVTVKLPARWAVLAVSDGVVEQTCTFAGNEDDFGIDRAAQVACTALVQGQDAAHAMQAVMNAVENFAKGHEAPGGGVGPGFSGRLALNDDATVVVVRGES
jgi:serine phosphatase RsbU (regulator of sigma subunit)